MINGSRQEKRRSTALCSSPCKAGCKDDVKEEDGRVLKDVEFRIICAFLGSKAQRSPMVAYAPPVETLDEVNQPLLCEELDREWKGNEEQERKEEDRGSFVVGL